MDIYISAILSGIVLHWSIIDDFPIVWSRFSRVVSERELRHDVYLHALNAHATVLAILVHNVNKQSIYKHSYRWNIVIEYFLHELDLILLTCLCEYAVKLINKMSGIELADIKSSIDSLCHEISILSTANEERDKKIENLITIITEKDKTIKDLEDRVDTLESYTNEMKRFTLKNNIIIKGLEITKPANRSYAGVVSVETGYIYIPTPEIINPNTSNAAVFRHTRKEVVNFINTSRIYECRYH